MARYLEKGFDEFRPPAWVYRFPGARFCAIAHNVGTEAQMRRSVSRAAELKIGNLFITDDVVPNPYDCLPSYWDAAALLMVSPLTSSPKNTSSNFDC